jgi:DNA repair exonuclease SbcCD ATPase subunit
MRLREVRMEGFRGYPVCRPLKLDYDVVIIFGDNGSGKSSLFNAMEWLLEDTVYLGDCRDASTGDRFRNLFTGCEEPWVQLTFSKKGKGRTTQYQVTRRLRAGTSQTSDVKREDELLQPPSFPDRLLSRKTLDEQGIAYSWPLRYGQGEFEQVFLNRKRLGKFIEVRASERGGQLLKLLGYGIFDEYRDTIDRLLAFLRRYRRDEGLERTFDSCCAVLESEIASIFEKYSGELVKTCRLFCGTILRSRPRVTRVIGHVR